MKIIFVFIFALLCNLIFGQRNYPSKRQLQKTLTRNTALKKHPYITTNWLALESDSSFKMADTLIFYDNLDYRYQQLICHRVEWNFYKKDAFWAQRIQLCKEPTTASAIKDVDMFTFEILDNQPKLIMQIFNKNLLVDRFEVLSFTKQPMTSSNSLMTSILKLHRIKG